MNAAGALPLPAASDALRDALANAPKPALEEFRHTTPETPAQWMSLVNANIKELSMQVEDFASRQHVTITPEVIAGVPVFHVMPRTIAAQHREHVLIYLHGGAYVFNPGKTALKEAVLIADTAEIPVLAIDYRMAPAHPFPAALDDVIAVYRHLLEERPGSHIALGGTSAGGGLALASTHKIKELELALPGAIYVGTPWADLTKTGDSFFINEGIDRNLPTYDGLVAGAARLYAGKHDLTNPLISPLYGDFSDFPPTFLITGTRDLLLSVVVRTHQRLKAAGVDAQLHVYEGFSHSDYIFFDQTPESKQLYQELRAFLNTHLP